MGGFRTAIKMKFKINANIGIPALKIFVVSTWKVKDQFKTFED